MSRQKQLQKYEEELVGYEKQLKDAEERLSQKEQQINQQMSQQQYVSNRYHKTSMLEYIQCMPQLDIDLCVGYMLQSTLENHHDIPQPLT